MPFTTGMSLSIDPIKSAELLYGGVTKIWNFFSKNNLQPATATYFANCALYGGDSDGWRESLQELTLFRAKQGFQFGAERPLSIGFPGADILPTLLDAEYGSRWLGVLFVLATIQDQDSGAHNLDSFVRKTASNPTRQFLLDRENCERFWTIAREIFAASPYWYHLLNITSSILANVEQVIRRESPNIPSELPKGELLLKLIFPDAKLIRAGTYLQSIMTAGFDLWQLSQGPESRGKLLWARGGVGCAQLIFYLTTVCGFRVKLGVDNGSVIFGDPTLSQVEVVVQIVLEDVLAVWETGYFFENESVEASVRQILADSSEEHDWRTVLDPNTKRSLSKYRIDMNTRLLGTSPRLSPRLAALVEDIRNHAIVPFVSHWFSDKLHNYMDYRFVHSRTMVLPDFIIKTDSRIRLRSIARSENLQRAIAILDPGILTDEDSRDLIRKIREMEIPSGQRKLSELIPEWKIDSICYCASHGRNTYKKWRECIFEYYASLLTEVAQQIWICSYVSTNPEYLRDMGTNVDLEWGKACVRSGVTEAAKYSLDTLVMAIATCLAGRKVIEIPDCLGRVAGGFVIGVYTNEDLSIFEDPGHSIYILPGGIATQERRFKQVIEETELQHIRRPTEENSRMLFELTTAQDYFGKVELKHEIYINSDTAVMSSALYRGGKKLWPLTLRHAIDIAPFLVKINGCLNNCIQGGLGGFGLSKVAVVLPDKTHYLFRPEPEGEVSEDLTFGVGRDRLVVFPVHGNVLLQRSIISQPQFLPRDGFSRVAVLVEGCTHCAIQQSLNIGIIALIC